MNIYRFNSTIYPTLNKKYQNNTFIKKKNYTEPTFLNIPII